MELKKIWYIWYIWYIYICINIDLGCEHSTRCKKNIRLPSSQFNNHGEFKDRPHLLRRMNSLERTYAIFGISMTAPHLLFPQQRFLNCLRWILHDMTTMSYICAGLQNSNIGHVQLHRSNAWIPWMAAPLSFTHATISLQRQEVPPVPILKAQWSVSPANHHLFWGTLVTLAKLRHLQKTTSSIWYL